MNYPTCGEISCEECNDRYEKAMDRITALEKMVRELVESCELFGTCGTMYVYGTKLRCNTCTKALALLQPEAGKEVGR